MALQWTELGDVLSRFEARLASIEQKLNEPNGQREWFSSERAAEYLDVTLPSLRAAERSGKLDGHRDGSGRLKFRRGDLDNFATSEK